MVKLKSEEIDGEGDDCESGRSTASVESSSNLSGENNNVLFPLCKENLHRVNFVKALKPATDTVNNLRNDLILQSEKFLGLDFKG